MYELLIFTLERSNKENNNHMDVATKYTRHIYTTLSTYNRVFNSLQTLTYILHRRIVV